MAKYKKISVMHNSEYREMWDKLQDLKGRLTEAEAFQDKLQNQKPSESEQRQRQVGRLLAGESIEDIETEKTWLESLSRARETTALIRGAVEVQNRLVTEKHVEVSRRILEPQKPEISRRVQRRAELYIQIGEAIEDDREYESSFEDVGQRYLLDLHQMPRLGRPRDQQSLISTWLIEAVKRGDITFKAIPQTWRENWYKNTGFKLEGDNTLKSTPAPGGNVDYANYLERNKDTVANVIKRVKDHSLDETKTEELS